MIRRVLSPSISRRVFLALVSSCVMVWAAFYFLGSLGVEAPELGNFDREMRTVANAMLQMANEQREQRELRASVRGLAAYIEWNRKVHGTPSGFLSLRVVDAAGTEIAASDAGPSKWPDLKQPAGFFNHASDGGAFRVLRMVSDDGRLTIDVASSEVARRAVWDGIMLSPTSFFPLLYALPLILLPAWLAVRSGLKPLRHLSKELSARRSDDLSPIRAKGVYLELTPLISELNGSFQRIELLLNRERSFLADAAHELRTPLAVMVAQTDTLRNAAGDQARQAALKRLDGGLLRASRLVNQLLALARLEAEQEELATRVDLADVARDCLALYAQVARTQGIELSYVGPDSLVDECPQHCLESIMDNLVGNAVRYGGPGARIEVGLARLPSGRVQLQVRDDGPGVRPEDLPHLFERFRRGRETLASGSGLGLAIVKSAARRLSARIEVVAGLDGKGVEFKLEWPAASA